MLIDRKKLNKEVNQEITFFKSSNLARNSLYLYLYEERLTDGDNLVGLPHQLPGYDYFI